jgi:hypothetical protein
LKAAYQFRPQEGGGYIVFHDGDRIGWTRQDGRRWAATDAEMKSAGSRMTRHEAAVRLHRRYRKTFGEGS